MFTYSLCLKCSVLAPVHTNGMKAQLRTTEAHQRGNRWQYKLYSKAMFVNQNREKTKETSQKICISEYLRPGRIFSKALYSVT